MKQKEKGRPSVDGTQDGKRNCKRSKATFFIVRQSGYPVNGVFPCGLHREVYDLLPHPKTIEQIATMTGSTIDRVLLALNDLEAAGVVIRCVPYE